MTAFKIENKKSIQISQKLIVKMCQLFKREYGILRELLQLKLDQIEKNPNDNDPELLLDREQVNLFLFTAKEIIQSENTSDTMKHKLRGIIARLQQIAHKQIAYFDPTIIRMLALHLGDNCPPLADVIQRAQEKMDAITPGKSKGAMLKVTDSELFHIRRAARAELETISTKDLTRAKDANDLMNFLEDLRTEELIAGPSPWDLSTLKQTGDALYVLKKPEPVIEQQESDIDPSQASSVPTQQKQVLFGWTTVELLSNQRSGPKDLLSVVLEIAILKLSTQPKNDKHTHVLVTPQQLERIIQAAKSQLETMDQNSHDERNDVHLLSIFIECHEAKF